MVDAVFELRFSSGMPVSAVLPGALYSYLESKGKKVKIHNLPHSQMPSAIRDSDPNFKYIPLVRLEWNGFATHIGDGSVGVLCIMPYRTWKEFREEIVDVIGKTLELGAIKAIERFALKYVNLFQEKSIEQAISGFNLSLKVGGHQLTSEPAQIRMEIKHSSFVHALHLVTQATVGDSFSKTKKSGAVLEVDSVSTTRWTNLEIFRSQLEENLDAIHAANKEIFFDCLRPELIKNLGAKYD